MGTINTEGGFLLSRRMGPVLTTIVLSILQGLVELERSVGVLAIMEHACTFLACATYVSDLMLQLFKAHQE